MSGFTVTGKGKLTRNPMTVTAADAEFAKLCLMNADVFYAELWLHAGGRLGAWIAENLTAGTEIGVKAQIHPKSGKLRYLRSSHEHVLLITEMEVDGTTFV